GGVGSLAKLTVLGDADEKQFVIKANGTQSLNIFEIQNSSGVPIAWVDGLGNFGSSGTIYGSIATSTWYGSIATSTWYGNIATSTFPNITVTNLVTINKSSSTLASIYSGLFVGTTATTSIYGQTTSTFPYGITLASNGGNVGIGTANPSNLLTLFEDGSASNLFAMGNGSATTTLAVGERGSATSTIYSDAWLVGRDLLIGGLSGSGNLWFGNGSVTSSLKVGDRGSATSTLYSDLWLPNRDLLIGGNSGSGNLWVGNGSATTTVIGGMPGLATSTFAGDTVISNLYFGSIEFDEDGGILPAMNIPVATAASGTIEGYTFDVDGLTTLVIGGRSDALSSVWNRFVGVNTSTPYNQEVFSVNGTMTVGSYGSQNGTSTFYGDIAATGTLAVSGHVTSTFANGIQLSSGCFMLPSGECAGTGSGSESAAGWQQVNRQIYLIQPTDNVTIGASGTLAKLTVLSDADEKQLVVQATSTQSKNIFEIQTSAGGILAWVNPIGNFGVSGTIYGSLATSTYYGTLYGNSYGTLYGSISTTTLDGVTIGGSTAATGTFTGLQVNETASFNGIVNIGDNGDAVIVNSNTWDISAAGVISGAQLSTSTLDSVAIGNSTASTGKFTNVSSTILSSYRGLFVGTTATTSIFGQTTSTFPYGITLASNGGNVGIGTTNPSNLLTLFENGNASNLFAMGNGSATTTLAIGNRGSATSTLYSDLWLPNRDLLIGGNSGSGNLWLGNGTVTSTLKVGNRGSATSTLYSDLWLPNRDLLIGGNSGSGNLWVGNGSATTTIVGGMPGYSTSTFEGDVIVSNLYSGMIEFTDDGGVVTAMNVPITNAASGTIEGYTFDVDGISTLVVGGRSDALSSVWNRFVGVNTSTPYNQEVFSVNGTMTVGSFGTNLGGTSTFYGNIASTGTIQAGDNVIVGSSQSAWNLAKLTVLGDADEKQFVIMANATQNRNAFEVENSSGAPLAWINSSGGYGASGTSYMGSIMPAQNNTYDLGAFNTAWRNIYASGTVWVGATAALDSDSLLFNKAANISATTSLTIGDNTQTIAINSNDWDISTTGDITGVSGNISMWSNDSGYLTSSTAGTMAMQNANSVAITGGEIDGTDIGLNTRASGKFHDIVVGGAGCASPCVQFLAVNGLETMNQSSAGVFTFSTTTNFDGSVRLGDNTYDVVINSNTWDISSAGVTTNLSITTSTLDGVAIGGSTRSSGNFTTLNANGSVTFGDSIEMDTATFNSAVTFNTTIGVSGFATFSGGLNVGWAAQYTEKLCHSGSDGALGSGIIGDCNSSPGDIAEYYGSRDTTIAAGDVVKIADYIDGKPWIEKTSSSYSNTLGVVSTAPYDSFGKIYSSSTEYSVPIALVGRVPVKVSNENGPIEIGDYLTSASLPGYAMKMTKPGITIGQALSSFDGSTASGTVTVFMGVGYYDSETFIAYNEDRDLTVETNENNIGPILTANSDLDMESKNLINIASLQGMENKWSISENGDFTIAGEIIKKIFTSQGEKDFYPLYSKDPNIILSGSGELINGEARIIFEPALSEIMDPTESIKVNVTMTSEGAQGLYVAEKSIGDILVREINGGKGGARFDYMIIAKRKMANSPLADVSVSTEATNEDSAATSTPENSPAVPMETPDNSGATSTPIIIVENNPATSTPEAVSETSTSTAENNLPENQEIIVAEENAPATSTVSEDQNLNISGTEE
ncbi:MAG: hypothetical protein WC459_01475, partial [Patescibacteria group bacterium]